MKRALTAALALLLVFSGFACRPTPEKDIVGNKGDGTLENAVRTEIDPAAQIDVPPSYTFGNSYFDGQVTLNINATVEFPAGKALPVWSAEITPWTLPQIEKIVRTLYGENAEFTDAGDYGYTRTKSDIAENELKPLQQLLQDLRDGKDIGGDESGPFTETDLLSQLEYWQRAYAAAPETRDEHPVQLSSYTADAWWMICGTLPCGLKATFETRANKEHPLWVMCRLQRRDGYYIGLDRRPDELGLRTTPAQAQVTAEEFVRSISDTEFAMILLSSAQAQTGGEGTNDPSRTAYSFTFVPVVNGLRTCYDPYQKSGGKDAGGGVFYVFDSEHITVCVNDEGICEFYWYSPTVITGTRSGNVQLKAFSEIMERAQEQLPLQNADYWKNPGLYNNHIIRETIDVTKIKLSYYRVLERNSDGGFLWLPVWEFYGNITSYLIPEIQNGEYNVWPYDITPILIINAIDGTIVDTNVGY